MSHIFISYSKHDSAYAHKLVARLRQEGYDVWIDDRRLRSSDDWWPSIVHAIWGCAAIIVIMSPASDRSRWVQREITIADQRQKPIYPLLLEGGMDTPNWSIFVRTQFQDVRGAKLPSQAFFDDLQTYAPRRPGAGGSDVTGSAHMTLVAMQDKDFQAQIANPPHDLEELRPDSPRRNMPRMKMALLAGVVVVGIAVLGIVLRGMGADADDNATPTVAITATVATAGVTQAVTPGATANADLLNREVTLEWLNAWRGEQGYPPLVENTMLTQVAESHMAFLANLTLDELDSQPLNFDADGLDAAFMAQDAGYAGEVQMFVVASDSATGTLGELLDQLEAQGGGDVIHTRYAEMGLAVLQKPGTNYLYRVALFGQPDDE